LESRSYRRGICRILFTDYFENCLTQRLPTTFSIKFFLTPKLQGHGHA